MQAAPARASGAEARQGEGLTIINVSSKQQAAQEAARERAVGRQVIANTIIDEPGQWSGTRIRRVLQQGGM
jgi:hypothetical protein